MSEMVNSEWLVVNVFQLEFIIYLSASYFKPLV